MGLKENLGLAAAMAVAPVGVDKAMAGEIEDARSGAAEAVAIAQVESTKILPGGIEISTPNDVPVAVLRLPAEKTSPYINDGDFSVVDTGAGDGTFYVFLNEEKGVFLDIATLNDGNTVLRIQYGDTQFALVNPVRVTDFDAQVPNAIHCDYSSVVQVVEPVDSVAPTEMLGSAGKRPRVESEGTSPVDVDVMLGASYTWEAIPSTVRRDVVDGDTGQVLGEEEMNRAVYAAYGVELGGRLSPNTDNAWSNLEAHAGANLVAASDRGANGTGTHANRVNLGVGYDLGGEAVSVLPHVDLNMMIEPDYPALNGNLGVSVGLVVDAQAVGRVRPYIAGDVVVKDDRRGFGFASNFQDPMAVLSAGVSVDLDGYKQRKHRSGEEK